MAAWKSSISFSDRFSVITQIADTLTIHYEIDSAEALKAAQAAENDYLSRASSHVEYVQLWKHGLSAITAVNSHSPDTHGPTTSEEAPAIGPYTNPTYYADGANSTVYKSAIPSDHCNFPTPSGHPTSPGLTVALKVTVPSAFSPPHDAYSEAKILNAILPHETILPLLETFTTTTTPTIPSRFILVFPFYPYSLATLPACLQWDTEAQYSFLKNTFMDIFSALAHLHKHGIIHRDIKPSNILFSHPLSSSRAYLADFGISWSESTHAKAAEPLENKVTDVGTTHYRPIELLFGYKAYGTELDLWAAGCVVAECFSNDLSADEWHPFFDAGDLGSELRLIASIFQKLGTPTDESWLGSSKLPDWGKIQFREFPRKNWEELLPNAPPKARDLVDRLLKYEGSERVTAAEVLDHPFLAP